MSSAQIDPTNSPFSSEQTALLNALIPTMQVAQAHWLSGFLTAWTLHRTESVVSTPTSIPVVVREVTVLYASQTGNSERVAMEFARRLDARSCTVTTASMRDFKPNQLKKVRHLFIITSTHGEGEPPDNGKSFYDFLHSARAPRLEGLSFGVLALGDTSYALFCQTGIDFDQRLEVLGATRLLPRVDCDVDYEEQASAWMDEAIAAFIGPAPAPSVLAVHTPNREAHHETSTYSRTAPFIATVLENTNLNGRGSDRETRHLVLSLEHSQLTYAPGDCIGLFPKNDPHLVQTLLATLGWTGDEYVPLPKSQQQVSLEQALLQHYEVTVVSKSLMTQLVAYSQHPQLHNLLQPGNESLLKAYIQGIDLLDVMTDFAPWTCNPTELVGTLRKLPPRLYSISSSQRTNPDEVHVTIRAVRYMVRERMRHGVCSVHCAERLREGDTIPLYVHTNSNFALPESDDTPIIMVGPGTGVAPFRAFMEERAERRATGKSWLFFGDRRFATDFLYQVEWQRWLKEGVLTKLDVAFSRDTAEKVYVQHRMLQHAQTLYAWLKEGAVFYVCGDATHMAHDVHQALLTIISQQGNVSVAQAQAYVEEMAQQRRYQRDVY